MKNGRKKAAISVAHSRGLISRPLFVNKSQFGTDTMAIGKSIPSRREDAQLESNVEIRNVPTV